MNLKKLATSGAALVALTAPAFLASQATLTPIQP